MGQNTSHRILLIDAERADHEDFRGILRTHDQASSGGALQVPTVLENLDVDVASHGPEGRVRVREALGQGRPYLLAVVDLHLAGEWDGTETVRRLWEEDPALPALFCTQRDRLSADRRDVARRLGQIDRFLLLSKPWDPDEVRQMVAFQADRRLARGELQEVTGELGRALQQARKEAQAADRAKSEFMANISHEIRTPMNAILGFTRLLMSEPLNADQLKKLCYVRDAGTSLLSLIDNVLDYAKLVAGQLKLSDAPFNLDAVFADVLEATRPPAREKGLAVQHHTVATVPRWLCGDKTRFRQILVNLINNAIKFTEQGSIHVQTTLDEQTEQTATLRVVVTDTGVGIPVQRQAIIFESFSQADGSSTRQFEGVGLGLSICKRLVDLMGGQIGFRSDSGQGSSFWLTLTLKKHVSDDLDGEQGKNASLLGEASREDSRDAADTQLARPYVLVADDDHLNRTLAEMLLGRVGCLVDLAGNGEEALTLLRKTRYDLVLMDVEMPRMNGPKAIEQIRREEQTIGRRLPIVTLTAGASPEERTRCLQAGADEHITKPFTPELLISTVCRYLPQCREPSESMPAAEGSDLSHRTQECLRTLDEALAEKNFHDLENSAGILKSLSLQSGAKSAADHAMRVQLAARSSDLNEAASAIRKLQATLQERGTAVPESRTSFNPSP